MCGIFGILTIHPENIHKRIIEGLTQLQNRGYDSSGLAVIDGDGNAEIHKYASTNQLDSLEHIKQLCQHKTALNYVGIGHNRWATHGMKNDTNAHPHVSCHGKYIIVHNGIIENYVELRNELVSNGFTFRSQTDSEIIVNMVEYYSQLCENNTYDALNNTIQRLRGTYGIILLDLQTPYHIYCVRNGSPLLIGKNDNNVIITSEQSGFCNQVSNYITLNNDDICVISISPSNQLQTKTTNTYSRKKISMSARTLVPDPFPHWTIREIHEQPTTVLSAINNGGRIKNGAEVKLGGLECHADRLKTINNIVLLGCGTSYYAGLYGAHFFKWLCGFNVVQTIDGADLTEQDIPRQGNTAFILISQSGETKDLHRCIEIAKASNIMTIGIINVVDSLIAREVDCGIYCNAGIEVGVASTKAFSSQVVCLSLAAIWFSQTAEINEQRRAKVIHDLNNLSNDLSNVLDMLDMKTNYAPELTETRSMFLLGKGTDEIVALEGSLKIKEITYIHAEGYSSSSLKHGPFALLDEKVPVIIFNLDLRSTTKTMNCVEEVLSRNAHVILITNDKTIEDPRYKQIYIPANTSYASLLGIIPIQLLAYNISVLRGINPDKPKNLAKVVSVE